MLIDFRLGLALLFVVLFWILFLYHNPRIIFELDIALICYLFSLNIIIFEVLPCLLDAVCLLILNVALVSLLLYSIISKYNNPYQNYKVESQVTKIQCAMITLGFILIIDKFTFNAVIPHSLPLRTTAFAEGDDPLWKGLDNLLHSGKITKTEYLSLKSELLEVFSKSFELDGIDKKDYSDLYGRFLAGPKHYITIRELNDVISYVNVYTKQPEVKPLGGIYTQNVGDHLLTGKPSPQYRHTHLITAAEHALLTHIESLGCDTSSLNMPYFERGYAEDELVECIKRGLREIEKKHAQTHMYYTHKNTTSIDNPLMSDGLAVTQQAAHMYDPVRLLQHQMIRNEVLSKNFDPDATARVFTYMEGGVKQFVSSIQVQYEVNPLFINNKAELEPLINAWQNQWTANKSLKILPQGLLRLMEINKQIIIK